MVFRFVVTAAAALLVGGCATQVATPRFGVESPVNAGAVESPVPAGSATLAIEKGAEPPAVADQAGVAKPDMGGMHQHSHGAPAPANANGVESAARPTPSVIMPAPASQPGAVAAYVCPMHKDVVSDHPGKCPKCGMALKAVAAASTQPAGHDHAGHGGAK